MYSSICTFDGLDFLVVVNCGTFSLPFTSNYYGVKCCGRVPRKAFFHFFFKFSQDKQKKKVGKVQMWGE